LDNLIDLSFFYQYSFITSLVEKFFGSGNKTFSVTIGDGGNPSPSGEAKIGEM
jgi:hypothetical protein